MTDKYTPSDLLTMAEELAAMYIELANLKIKRADPVSEYDKAYMESYGDSYDRHTQEAMKRMHKTIEQTKVNLDAQIIRLEATIRGAELRFDAAKFMFSHPYYIGIDMGAPGGDRSVSRIGEIERSGDERR